MVDAKADPDTPGSFLSLPGRAKGVASISVRLNKVILADGQEVSIAINVYGTSARSTKAKDATRIRIGAGVGDAIGAIAGGGKSAIDAIGVLDHESDTFHSVLVDLHVLRDQYQHNLPFPLSLGTIMPHSSNTKA